MATHLLVFDLFHHRFAVRATAVREIIRAVAIAPLPGAPKVVEGVINYRGNVTPVLDIRSRFGLSSAPVRPEQHLIVAEAGPRRVALRVDRARDLLSVSDDAIEAADRVAPGSRASVARLPDGLVVIHDLAGFLSVEEGDGVDGALQALLGAVAEGPE